MIDYLQEFEAFIGKQQLSAKQKEFVATRGTGGPAVRDGRAPGDGGMIAGSSSIPDRCIGRFAGNLALCQPEQCLTAFLEAMPPLRHQSPVGYAARQDSSDYVRGHSEIIDDDRCKVISRLHRR